MFTNDQKQELQRKLDEQINDNKQLIITLRNQTHEWTEKSRLEDFELWKYMNLRSGPHIVFLGLGAGIISITTVDGVSLYDNTAIRELDFNRIPMVPFDERSKQYTVLNKMRAEIFGPGNDILPD